MLKARPEVASVDAHNNVQPFSRRMVLEKIAQSAAEPMEVGRDRPIRPSLRRIRAGRRKGAGTKRTAFAVLGFAG